MIPITNVTGQVGQPNLFQSTGTLTIVLVVQINDMVAHFAFFVLIVFAKFVQTPQVLSKWRWNEVETAFPIFKDASSDKEDTIKFWKSSASESASRNF